jgi:hypothetical protein
MDDGFACLGVGVGVGAGLDGDDGVGVGIEGVSGLTTSSSRVLPERVFIGRVGLANAPSSAWARSVQQE